MVGSGAGRHTRPRQVRGRHVRPEVVHSLLGNDALVLRMHTQSPPMVARNVAPGARRLSRSMRLLPLSQGAVSPSASWTRTSTLLADVSTTGALSLSLSLSLARSPLDAVASAVATERPVAIRRREEARLESSETISQPAGGSLKQA